MQEGAVPIYGSEPEPRLPPSPIGYDKREGSGNGAEH